MNSIEANSSGGHLTSGQANTLVHLATARNKTISKGDAAANPRHLKVLVEKGFAQLKEDGSWVLTEDGQARCQTIYG